MRLRCARCGCFLSLLPKVIGFLPQIDEVEPCKRCLEEVRRQARPVSLLVRALRGV